MELRKNHWDAAHSQFASARPGTLKVLGIAIHTIDHFGDLPLWRYSMSFVYLKAYLRKFPLYDNVAFGMVNYYTNDSVDQVMESVRALRPDVVVFSVYVWNFLLYQEVAAAIEQFDPGILIVLGGPEVACETEQLLIDNPSFDVIVKGEGEHVFHDLVSALLDARALSTVRGITYRNGSEVIETGNQDGLALADLNNIPSVFVPEVFDWSDLAGSFVALETQRGCNFACGFCRYRKVGEGARFFALDRVMAELEFISGLKCKHLYLMDPTFNNKPDRAKAILRRIIDLDMNVTINAEMVPEMMDRELLELSIRAGMVNLEVGVQALKKSVLRIMQRPRNERMLIEKIEVAAALEVDNRKLNVIPQIIYGLPGDTFETYCESFNFLYELDVKEIAMYHLLVLRDTQYYFDREKYQMTYDEAPPHRLIGNYSFPAEAVTLAGKMSCAAMSTQYTLRGHIRRYCQARQMNPTQFFLDEVDVGSLGDAMTCSFPIYTREHLDVQLECLERIRQVFARDGLEPGVRGALQETEDLLNARLGVISKQAEGGRFRLQLDELEAELLALQSLRDDTTGVSDSR